MCPGQNVLCGAQNKLRAGRLLVGSLSFNVVLARSRNRRRRRRRRSQRRRRRRDRREEGGERTGGERREERRREEGGDEELGDRKGEISSEKPEDC